MKSIARVGEVPQFLPLAADDIVELHAARLLLLLLHCGSAGEKIEGLTKLAKLDFFVRYPDFFERVAEFLGEKISAATTQTESVMVRHHYGPWDKRYYQVLGFLEARSLIAVEKHKNTYRFSLTKLGKEKAKEISKKNSFGEMVEQMKAVKGLLGRKTGTQLKELVYAVFDEEVKNRKLGEIIG